MRIPVPKPPQRRARALREDLGVRQAQHHRLCGHWSPGGCPSLCVALVLHPLRQTTTDRTISQSTGHPGLAQSASERQAPPATRPATTEAPGRRVPAELHAPTMAPTVAAACLPPPELLRPLIRDRVDPQSMAPRRSPPALRRVATAGHVGHKVMRDDERGPSRGRCDSHPPPASPQGSPPPPCIPPPPPLPRTNSRKAGTSPASSARRAASAIVGMRAATRHALSAQPKRAPNIVRIDRRISRRNSSVTISMHAFRVRNLEYGVPPAASCTQLRPHPLAEPQAPRCCPGCGSDLGRASWRGRRGASPRGRTLRNYLRDSGNNSKAGRNSMELPHLAEGTVQHRKADRTLSTVCLRVRRRGHLDVVRHAIGPRHGHLAHSHCRAANLRAFLIHTARHVEVAQNHLRH